MEDGSIVAKALTIAAYLGKGYKVLATRGPLVDLPKSRLGIDIEGDFEPEYLRVRGSAPLVKELQKAAKSSRLVLLASDRDREGEAVSWHLATTLREKFPALPILRIAFNEITPIAILEAVRNPRPIDASLVEAQKSRRILDRLVGYNLSPLLWRRAKNGLSAGRVQSVALRLICDREREIETFEAEEYWGVEARFKKGRHRLRGELVDSRGKVVIFETEADAKPAQNAIAHSAMRVSNIHVDVEMQRPEPPYNTSTLLASSARRLGFSCKKTEYLARQLYEGVVVGATSLGLITYPRTDSLRVSEGALSELREWIRSHYAAELPDFSNYYEKNDNGSGAHEVIRPTTLSLPPESLVADLTSDQLRLYTLIWERYVASQMSDAKVRRTIIDLSPQSESGSELAIRVSSSMLVEKGYNKALKLSVTKRVRDDRPLPELAIGNELQCESLSSVAHVKAGPPRYTDASFIEMLDEAGIGRPSTFASIVSLLLERNFVLREGREFQPTTLGRIINDILVESFPALLDPSFTASLETRLDEVEAGRADGIAMIRDFWIPFKGRVDEVMAGIGDQKRPLDEATDLVCEHCGEPFVKRLGRNGFFLACSGFPNCRNTRSMPLAKCPRPGCGGEIVERRRAPNSASKTGVSERASRAFYGCTNYPTCDYISYYKPTSSICPLCGLFLVQRRDGRGGIIKACVDENCKFPGQRGEETYHGPKD